MSALFTFEVKTNVPAAEIGEKLAGFWGAKLPSYEISVAPHQSRSSLLCEVGIFSPTDSTQKPRIKQAVDYLLQIASDGRLYYYTWGNQPDEAKDADFQIGVNDIFDRYQPWLSDGACITNLRIPLKNHAAEN